MQRTDPRYQAAVGHLLDRINYEKSTDRPYTKNNYKLARMAYLLEQLGNPHLGAPVVHIAGTKGKGSVSWLLAEAFRRNGLRTGLYTSPHLLDLEERFVIDSQAIEPGELVELVEALRHAEDRCSASEHGQPTFFEMTTAISWLAFQKRGTQVNVVEVGLGGRLDSTNVCTPALCIITSISYDHQQQLGDTLAQIASEKAGIIKASIPVICGARAPEATEVIHQKAIEENSELSQLGRDFHVHWTPNPQSLSALLDYSDGTPLSGSYDLRMLGKHQADNAAIALASWSKLKRLGWDLNTESIVASLAHTQVPARLEILSSNPTWILDSAHNEASIDALCDALECYFPGRPKSVIFACSKDKKAPDMLERLAGITSRMILTQFQSNPRFTPVEKLLEIAEEINRKRRIQGLHTAEILVANDLNQAVRLCRRPIPPEHFQAIPEPNSLPVHVITGSFFIAAEAKLTKF